MTKDEAKIINNTIARLLSMREHSEFELLQKLNVKGFSPKLCEQQLQLFIDKRLQSDARYLESFVRSAFNKGKGPQHIRQSLKQHNIEGVEVKESIYNADFDWFELACKVREKRFGENPPADFHMKQKQMRFLQYRGFEQEHISAAFD
jgi:regulatory protein